MEPPATLGTEMPTSRLVDQLIAIMDGEYNTDVEVDQTLYPRPPWAVKQIVRASGLVENMCRHGIGHPHPASVAEFAKIGIMSIGVHGCDGCCCPETKEKIKHMHDTSVVTK